MLRQFKNHKLLRRFMWEDCLDRPFCCHLAPTTIWCRARKSLSETRRSSLVVYSCGATIRPENFKFDLKAAIIQLQPQMFPIRAIDLRQNDQWTVGWCLKLLQNVQAPWLRLVVERPIHHPFEWFSCTIFHWIADYKSDFQYCMSRKLIYLSSWLTFALHSP